MLDESDWARLARYLAGECSPDEAAAVRERMDRDPAWRAQAEAMRVAWDAAAESPRAWDTDAAWARLAARASVRARHTAPVRPVPMAPVAPVHPPRRWAAIAIAATVLAAVGLSTRVARRGLTSGDVVADTGRVYTTAPGQRAVIDLVDGTHVELGVASTLRVRRFPERRGERGRREVALDGEAVFEVVHDTTRPFLVHSGNAVTEDVGTRFVVRAYRGDPAVRVAVASGSVALRAAGAPNGSGTLLGPGDLGVLDAAGRATTSRADTAMLFAWTRGRLVFRDEPLGAVAAQLERWFGTPIIVSDDVTAARRVTLNVPAGSLESVLDVVTSALTIERTRDGPGWRLGPPARR